MQGNLDPLLLVTGGPALERRVGEILAALSRQPFIFNLGHGIVPATPPENVARLVDDGRPGACPPRSTAHRTAACEDAGSGHEGGPMLLWLKALHVIAVIAWMAGLLYLPRLFVYHCEAEKGSKQSETFKVMEHRLLRFIMNPAMIVVWVTGPWLAWAQGMLQDRWLWAKFALVVVLTGYHHALGIWRKDFAADRNVRDQRFYRLANEVPTALMVGIVILVVVKPF